MEVITLKPFQSTYKNRGQAAEQVFRYTLTGEVLKADNRKGAPDIDNIQIKTDRATLAIGQELQSYIDGNTAEIFAYVTRDLTKAYIMSKIEFLRFASSFITYDYDSQTKQGKTRLKTEGKCMRAYLERNAKRA